MKRITDKLLETKFEVTRQGAVIELIRNPGTIAQPLNAAIERLNIILGKTTFRADEVLRIFLDGGLVSKGGVVGLSYGQDFLAKLMCEPYAKQRRFYAHLLRMCQQFFAVVGHTGPIGKQVLRYVPMFRASMCFEYNALVGARRKNLFVSLQHNLNDLLAAIDGPAEQFEPIFTLVQEQIDLLQAKQAFVAQWDGRHGLPWLVTYQCCCSMLRSHISATFLLFQKKRESATGQIRVRFDKLWQCLQAFDAYLAKRDEGLPSVAESSDWLETIADDSKKWAKQASPDIGIFLERMCQLGVWVSKDVSRSSLYAKLLIFLANLDRCLHMVAIIKPKANKPWKALSKELHAKLKVGPLTGQMTEEDIIATVSHPVLGGGGGLPSNKR